MKFDELDLVDIAGMLPPVTIRGLAVSPFIALTGVGLSTFLTPQMWAVEPLAAWGIITPLAALAVYGIYRVEL